METARRRPWWTIGNLDSTLPTVLLAFLVAILCYYGDKLAYVLEMPPGQITLFYPPMAFLVAVLLLTPRRTWPVLIIAGLGALGLADLRSGEPIGTTILISLGNLVEALVATLGITRLFEGVPQLSGLKALAKYLAVAVILAPFVSAFLGVSGSVRGGYWLQWRLWFFADAFAFLTVTPAILTWVREGRTWARKSHNYLELAALMTLLVFLGYLTFMGTVATEQPVLLYSLVPVLLWAALRLGLKGVSTSMLVVASLAIWGAAHGRGPFAQQGVLNSVLSLQLFLFFAAVPFIFLAVLVGEQKRAQQALIDEQAKLAEAQRLAQVGSWQWDPKTDTVTWSKELYRMAGLDPSLPAVSYKEHPKLYTAESWERLRTAVEEALRTGTPYELDVEMVRTDGTRRWLIARGEAQRDTTGQIVQLRGTVQDITERKLAEAALSTMSRRLIEAQEEERSWLARELHDDVNQRLALLAVNLDRLKEEPPSTAAELKREIGEAGKQVENLASDIQDLSHRLHSSKLEHLGLVAAAAGFCREVSDRQKVEIDLHSENIPKELPKEISLSLFRVLQEALQNAIKHSGSRHVHVSLSGGSNEIELTVRDSGMGFDPEEAMKGRGIGLTSMKERLKLVKGEISIDSQLQRGTTIQARVSLIPSTKSAGAAG